MDNKTAMWVYNSTFNDISFVIS